MTNRTSPVGVVVLLLASLLALGCSAQTSAVFQALVEPAGVAEATADGGMASPDVAGHTWWPHPHGYAMALPAGWSGVVLDPARTGQLIDALALVEPGLANRVRLVIEASGAEVSSLAVDTSSGVTTPAFAIVLIQPTDGARARVVKSRVAGAIAALPGIQGEPARRDERLSDAQSVRFDYSIDDPDLGLLQLRSHLVRFGGQAYLVSFVAPAGSFEAAGPDFEAIAGSIRFGI
ncbi:hypothetical protein BH24CHL9_BH24CHL9_00260 [soil metagenome]